MNILDGKCEQCGTVIRYLGGNPRKCLECQGVVRNHLTKIVDADYDSQASYLSDNERGYLSAIKDKIIEEEKNDTDSTGV